MTFIAGIDPGTSGAVAVYSTESKGIVSMEDLPTWFETVGKKKRKRIDRIALMDMFEGLQMLGVELVVIEAVAARPRQSGMFAFGYGVGLLHMSVMYSKIMLETVPPSNWKKLLNVKGKSQGGDDDIIQRADELFPHDRHHWRGPKNGLLVDRAEAAMLAKFGGDHVWPSMQPVTTDDQLKQMYYKAETGA